MCKEKHTNLACGCTEFSGILNCPSLFKGCMGPRGEQDRVYDYSDEPCNLCKQNGWKLVDAKKEKDQPPDTNNPSDKKDLPRPHEILRPAKRKRADYDNDNGQE
jgi:hypothetical protein